MPSLHNQISQGKKRDLNTGYLCLKVILYKSSCFFSFLRAKSRPLFCYIILSIKEIRCFLLVKYFSQCKHKMHQTPHKKVLQQQHNRKTCPFIFYQLKIWWKLDDILRSWASTEPHLFCSCLYIYLHLHCPGYVAVTASNSTLCFGLWQLEMEYSHRA